MTNINKHLAKEIPLTEKVFKHTISDNYRYFEDIKNKDALEWIKEETKLSKEYLNENDLKDSILKEFKKLDKTFEFQINWVRNTKNHYYFLKRYNNEKEGKLYRINLETEKEELLIDFQKLENHKNDKVSLQSYSISPNEKHLSFLVGLNGKESGILYFLNLEDRTIHKDSLKNSRSFSATWVDDESFFYAKFPHSDQYNNVHDDMEVKFHVLGKEEDIVICSQEIFGIRKNKNNHWFIPYFDIKNQKLYIWHEINTDYELSLYSTDWENNKPRGFTKIFDFKDKIQSPHIFNDAIYFVCSKFSEDYEIRKSSLNNFDINNSELLFKSDTEVVDSEIYRDHKNVYFTTIKNGYNKLYKIENNKVIEIRHEEKGTITVSYDENNYNLVLSFTNFKTPNIFLKLVNKTLFKLDFFNNYSNSITFNNLEVVNTEYESHDGVQVPICFVHDKSLKKNAKNKCIIHAYGSYGMVYSQYFNILNMYLLKKGYIIAFANVRGGGEKGKSWHLAGKKETKANTWKDLIWAGKFLIAEKYTSPQLLACEGGSAGGIAVGMVANESVNIFNAIISNVGLTNPTRLGRNPGGGLSECGNPAIESEFNILLKMDSFQNVKESKEYPNMLFTAGMQDDRVDYWQPAKACAKIKKYNSSDNKIMLLAYEDYGHGGYGDSREMYLEDLAFQFAFLEKSLK